VTAPPQYTARRVVSVTDGDTFKAEVFVARDPFGTLAATDHWTIRLYGVQLPEVRRKGGEVVDKDPGGAEAMRLARGLLESAALLYLQVWRRSDARGRVLCDVWRYPGLERVSDELVKLGAGAWWDGTGLPPVVPYPFVADPEARRPAWLKAAPVLVK
jgi:endonuclease YncB( thermonuclease family)